MLVCKATLLVKVNDLPLHLHLLVLLGSPFQLSLLLFCGAVEVNGDLLAKLGIDVFLLYYLAGFGVMSGGFAYQRSPLSLRAHEVHEEDVEEGRHDEHQEEPPSDVVKGDRAGDQEDDICKIQTAI
jgi:hypothetical protein